MRVLPSNCEQELVQHTGGWSLDRIVSIRDRTWFGRRPPCPGWRGAPAPVPLHRFLRQLASDHLHEWRGTTEVGGHDAYAIDALSRFRWLSFAVPEDLLLSALPVEPPPRRVTLQSSALIRRRLLDAGVAEVHEHAGAAMDFEHLWGSVLAALTDSTLQQDALQKSAEAPLEGLLLRWLLAAACARCVLAEVFIHAGTASTERLDDFVRRRFHDSRASRHAMLTLLAALGALTAPRRVRPPAFESLQFLYRELHPAGDRALSVDTLDEFWRVCDPVAMRVGLSTPGAGERWLMRHGLAELEKREQQRSPDPLLEQVFWQVIRVRCQYYRFIVQRPLTAGLQWFIRFSDRIGGLRRPLQRLGPELAWSVAGSEEDIASLELRMTGADSALEIADRLRHSTRSFRHVIDRYRGAHPPELGLVLLFPRQRDPNGEWRQGVPRAYWRGTHAVPRPSLAGVRYADFLADQAGTARAFAALMRAVPLTLQLVRGVDVATDELGVPTWVVVPLYHFLAQASRYASLLPGARGAPPLRATAHVGEDYRHLMEGLRRIFETVFYVFGPSGGRLGHALALGTHPERWSESVGTVLMPVEERLWDLVFEWRLYSGFNVPPELRAVAPSGREEYVAIEIRRLAHEMFGASRGDRWRGDPGEMAAVHHALHTFTRTSRPEAMSEVSFADLERALRSVRYCADENYQGYADAVRCLLPKCLTEPDVFRRGQALVDVPIDTSEVAALGAVQSAIRRGVAARGIVVEVNPSSNLLIGDLLDLGHHPLLRLFPPEPDPELPPVPIAVGSDDPVTFDTSLFREYALLYQTARAAGYTERVAHAWLDAIRSSSMDCRFTLSWGRNPRMLASDLIAALEDFLQVPSTGRHR